MKFLFRSGSVLLFPFLLFSTFPESPDDYFCEVPADLDVGFFNEEYVAESTGSMQLQNMKDSGSCIEICNTTFCVRCIEVGEEIFNIGTQKYEQLARFLYTPGMATWTELEGLGKLLRVGQEVLVSNNQKLKFVKIEQILFDNGVETVPALLVESMFIRDLFSVGIPAIIEQVDPIESFLGNAESEQIIEEQVHSFTNSQEFLEAVSLPEWMRPLVPALTLIVSIDCKYWKNNQQVILALSEIASEPILFFSKFLKAMIGGDLSLAEELWQYKPLHCITIPVFKITYFMFLISMPVSNENLAETLKRYRKVNYQTRNTKNNNICYLLLKHLTAIAIDVLDPTITSRELKKEIFLKRMASIYDEFIPLMPILEQFERRMLSKILSGSE